MAARHDDDARMWGYSPPARTSLHAIPFMQIASWMRGQIPSYAPATAGGWSVSDRRLEVVEKALRNRFSEVQGCSNDGKSLAI